MSDDPVDTQEELDKFGLANAMITYLSTNENLTLTQELIDKNVEYLKNDPPFVRARAEAIQRNFNKLRKLIEEVLQVKLN